MFVYNPTCFGFTVTFRQNTIVIGRFQRPLHIVPNIKVKELSSKDIDVIRDYK
jgi:lipoate-protein ligase A